MFKFHFFLIYNVLYTLFYKFYKLYLNSFSLKETAISYQKYIFFF